MSDRYVPAPLQFLRSAIAGSITALFELAVFLLLIAQGHQSPVLAAPLSLGSGIVINFLLSRHWVFTPSGKRLRHEMSQFAVIAAIDMAGEWLQFTGLYFLVHDALLAKLVTMGVWFIINFMLKQEVFRAPISTAVLPQVLKLYKHASLGVRLHVAVRWLSCPLEVIARRLPAEGSVLEIGCGYGSLVVYLAKRHTALSLSGTEIDERKLVVARHMVVENKQTDRVVFILEGDVGKLPDRRWDAIVMADVLYLMTEDEQRRLVQWAAAHLTKTGCLYVKMMSPSLHWKAAWNRFQETISVRILHLTKGDGGDFHFPSPDMLATLLRAQGFRVSGEPLDYGYLHPHYLLEARRE